MRANRAYLLALGLIALVAAYLRLDRLDLTEFRREEANALLLATNFLATGHPPLTSISTSVEGLENGPLQVYLVTPALLIARDAALASALIALLNVAAVVVAALVAERAYGRPAALFAGATYAVGAWAVYFSRKIWPNDPMPLFSALLALSLLDAVVAGRRRGVALAGLWLGALLNLHPSSLSLLPFVGLALLSRPRLLRSREALVGAAAVFLVSTPFLYHQLRDGLPAARALRGVATQPTAFDAASFGYVGQIVGPGAYRFLASGADDLFAGALPEGWLTVAMAALLWLGAAAGAVAAWRAWRRGEEWRAKALPVAWAITPAIVATRHPIDLWVHYFIFLTPALFVLVGLALTTPLRFAARASLGLRAAALGVPCAVVLWAGVVQVQQQLLFWDVLDRGAMRTVYGTPWGVQQEAADRALAAAGDGGVDLISQRPEHSGADDYLPVWRFLVPDRVPLRFDDGAGWLRLTNRDTAFVLSPTADPRAADLLAAHGATELPALPLAGLPQPGFTAGYRFFRGRASASGETGAGVARLEGGLRLERAVYPPVLAPGAELPVSGDWRVDARPPPGDLAFFAQLVDDKLQRLDGGDRGGVEAAQLEPGDQLVTWANLKTPAQIRPGRYWLLYGARRVAENRHIAVLDSAGSPSGDVVKVGPLKVPLAAAPAPATTLARFAGGVELAAAPLPTMRAGQPATLALTWRATARPAADLTVFVHLLDGTGKISAQDDRQPASGAYPTGIWDAGESIPDPHPLTAPAGRYRVEAGLYDAATGARLQRADGGAPSDAVDLGTVDVAP